MATSPAIYHPRRPRASPLWQIVHRGWDDFVSIYDTFEPIDPPWPAIREWIPADATDPLAVFPEDILSTHWVPKEIRLDDERTLVLDPS